MRKSCNGSQYLRVSPDSVRRGSYIVEEEALAAIPDKDGVVEICLSENLDTEKWSRYSCLVLKIYAEMDAMASVDICFYKSKMRQKPDNILNYQMLPMQEVTILVDFKELRSQRYFIKTIPGMFKGHCSGLPAEISEMRAVRLVVHPGYSRKFERFIVKECYLTENPPTVKVEGTPMVDEFGQWIQKGWDTKTHSEEELVSYLKAEYERAKGDCSYPAGFSRFGGTKKVVFDRTGYFHLVKTDKRWWLADPEGYGFFSNGICYGSRMGVFGFVDGLEKLFSWLPEYDDPNYKDAWTNAGEIAEYVKRNGKESGVNRKMFNFARANMIRAFGPDGWWEAWHTINSARIKRWGFNTIGVGVNNYFDERVMEYLEKAEIPFVWTLKEFPQTERKVFRDFPDVYAEEYRQNAKMFAEIQLSPFKGNPYLIGYFINNEPEWRFQEVNLAERVFASREPLESRKALVAILKDRYGTVEMLNQSWNTEFSGFPELYQPIAGVDRFSEQAAWDCRFLHNRLIEQYERVVALELKKVDPDHLDLGMRYSSADVNVMGGCKAHDVFSFNCYRTEPESVLAMCGRKADVPMMIGEWHIGGGDKGNLSHGLLASPDQEERGKALEYYLQRAMSNPNCVGAHYFEMNDQPFLGRFDGECMEHGLIDICNRQFDPVVKHLQHTNILMYDFVDGTRVPTETEGLIEKRR